MLGELLGYLGVCQDSRYRDDFGSLVQAVPEERYSGYEICDKSWQLHVHTSHATNLHRFVTSFDC